MGEALHDHKVWIEPLARAGYGSRGIVYLIIGFFAVLAAFGGGDKKNSRGALEAVLGQPFGEVLLWALVVGMAGYSLWRLIQSLFDTDEHGLDAKGLAIRGGLLASAVTYSLLAVYALSLMGVVAGGSGNGGGGGFARTLSAFVGANWVALGLSLVFLGVAVAHFIKAVGCRYRKHMDADADKMRIIDPVAVAGLIARGLVFLIIAFLLFYRFWTADSDSGNVPGLRDALDFVQGLPFGQLLLGAMGVGIILFAVYSMFQAVYRRVNLRDA